MICENCKKNEAKVRIVKIINGEKSETWLCEKCAKELSEQSFMAAFNSNEGASFQNILNGYFDTLNKDKKEKIEVICKNCGLTYSQYKKSGQLGCPECYDSFYEYLKPIIKKIQGDDEHIGKIPVKSGNEFIQKKRLNKMKEELQNCIKTEEYEQAAVLRDKIRELQGVMEASNEKLDR